MPGISGNPGGRPRGLAREVREREGRKSFDILLQIRDSRLKGAHWTKGKKKMIAVASDLGEVLSACKIILAYCYGQPSQKLEVEDTRKLVFFPIGIEAPKDNNENGKGTGLDPSPGSNGE